jgi:hypothetical protein
LCARHPAEVEILNLPEVAVDHIHPSPAGHGQEECSSEGVEAGAGVSCEAGGIYLPQRNTRLLVEANARIAFDIDGTLEIGLQNSGGPWRAGLEELKAFEWVIGRIESRARFGRIVGCRRLREGARIDGKSARHEYNGIGIGFAKGLERLV